jgi:hypothetical protein
MLSYLLDDNPGAVGYIFEPSYRMVRRILIPTLEGLLGTPIESNHAVEEYTKTESRIDFRNGSKLWFGGLEEPEMAEGPNIDLIQADEARLVRHFDTAWQVIQRRLRGSTPGKYHTGAYVTTTPDAPGSVLHNFFENPTTKNPDSQTYRMSIDDNIHLPSDYVEGIKRTHHGGLAERFLYGRFAAVGAGTVPFDYTVHVVKTIDPSTLTQIVYGVDFGWTNPSCILAIGFDSDGRAYVLEEFYLSRVPQDRLLLEAKEMTTRWGKGTFYCDPTQTQTIESWKSAGLNAVRCEAKRDEGIREMAGRFQVLGDKQPRIFIASECVNLTAELQAYDETVKENDHAVDALRYALASKMKRKPDIHAWVFGGPLS